MEPKKCEKCDGACQPIALSSAPERSEWYCHKCHKSHPMDREVAERILMFEAKQGRRG